MRKRLKKNREKISLQQSTESTVSLQVQNPPIEPDDMRRVLYELHNHQIELEMQNEELRRVQQELVEARDRYRDLYDFAPLGYLTISNKGLIIEVNLTFAKMLGLERAKLLQRPLSSLIARPDQDSYYLYLLKFNENISNGTSELRMKIFPPALTPHRLRKMDASCNIGNDVFWAQIDGTAMSNELGEMCEINFSVYDITDKKLANEKLEQLASFDQLTHLPNRYLLETQLDQRIKVATRFRHKLAILFIDVDQFKAINDTLGHEYGDILLQLVAQRLASHLREYDAVYRFGGDEFVLILSHIKLNNEVVSVADKIIREFSSVFQLKEEEVFVTTSIGISMYPDDGKKVGSLLQNADAAMYRAKDAGGDRYRFFTHAMNNELRRHQMIAADLRLSIKKNEFKLMYQPQMDLLTGKIESCEALLRWFPPSDLNISPNEFIPIAEKSKLINSIGAWVINEACRQRAIWKEQGLIDLRIDFNLSGKELLQHNFFSMLDSVLKKHSLEPSDIGIELTENVLIQADKNNFAKLRALDDAGMRISIDDFGTGYSSLSYLRKFPVHNLKIDQEFIRDAPTNKDDRSIMEAIVAVGHRLGHKVIAEGVETHEQHLLVQEMECDYEQGYYFYKPMLAEHLFGLLRSSSLRA